MNHDHASTSRARPPWALLLLAVGLVGALLSACAGEGDPPRRAILIVLDAARADRFSCNGYERETTPHMDRLAGKGMNYRRHFANGSSTRNSMPTLMYSRYFVKAVFPYYLELPEYRPIDLFRTLDAEAISLSACLERDGIHTVGISAHQWFQEDTEYALEFGEFHDLPRRIPYPEEHGYPRAEALVDYTIDWIEGADPEQEFLLYLHLMDTHFPHLLEEDAAHFFGADTYETESFDAQGYPLSKDLALSGRDREYMDALYDGSLRYTDRHLGRLFDFLEERGELDSTLIAITADHGEELLHTPRRFSHGSWWEPVAHIPMILSYPQRVAPGVTDALTSNVDVYPTIVELLDVGLPPGKSVDGTSLLEGLDGTGREVVYAWCGIRTERLKAMGDLRVFLEDPETPRFRFYDLASSPDETSEVGPEWREEAERLLADCRERLGPRFERFDSARDDRPPRWEFAVGARDLRATGVDIPVGGGPGWWEELESDSGWVRTNPRRASCLIARTEAVPLEITIPIPSGEYELSVALWGRCRITPEGMPGPVEIEGPAFDPRHIGRSRDLVPVGTILVQDGVLRARVEPDTSDGWLQLTKLGLVPVGLDVDDEEARKRREALGKLGYGG